MDLHDRFITICRCIRGIRLIHKTRVRAVQRITETVRTIDRSLLEVFVIRLRSILPTPSAMTSGTGVTRLALIFEYRSRTAAACIVGIPSRYRRCIADSGETCTAGPCTLHRYIIKQLILYLRGNCNEVTLHTVQFIGLCKIIALCPADISCRLRLNIHVIVFRTVTGNGVRNNALGKRSPRRQIVRTVSKRNLDLLRSPCARQMELKVVLDKGLRVCRRQSRRENNLIELVRAENIRKGLDTGRRAEKFNAAHIDLEVHRGDAGSRCVGDRHVL